MTGVLIATIALVSLIILWAIWCSNIKNLVSKKRGRPFQTTATIFVLLVATFLFLNLSNISASDWVQISLYVGIVGVTAIYAYSTHLMASEMKSQRISQSRPWIIQRDDIIPVLPRKNSTRYFEITNVGNGPAIDVQVSLVRKRDWPYEPSEGKRYQFLRKDDDPVQFVPGFPNDLVDSTFYILSEYEGTSQFSETETIYQTWLPCKLSITGDIIAGKLEFDEVKREKGLRLFQTDLAEKSND